MDYQSFVTQTLSELEEPTGWGLFTATQVLNWTNAAIRDFAKKTRCVIDEQYASTVPAQKSYALPSGTIDPKVVMYGARVYPLTRMTVKEWYRADAENVSGEPAYYAVFDEALWLYPTPSVAATLHFTRSYIPTEVASVSATSEMPFSDADAVGLYVKARAYEQLGDERAGLMENRYQREVADTTFETVRSQSTDTDNAPVEVY